MILILLLANFAQADSFDPQVIAARLVNMIPAGKSEGVNRAGEACQIIQGYLPAGPDTISIIRTQILNKRTKKSASAEINFGRNDVAGTGNATSALVVAVQGKVSLGAFSDPNSGLIVYVENKKTNQSEDCVLQ